FCRIVEGTIPADIVYQDADVTAFRDISPQAPTHILIVPNRHIASLEAVTTDDVAVLGKLFLVAQQLAESFNLNTHGYRVVVNTGRAAGQSVYHLHMHLLGGRSMHWPPG
ncbi:MAG: histidine triad nucleotide-binding protein, partial [Anaerolineae bacterium]|nr:histidine triad nucleotide-binding protein [Anaerolineae bacterium]